jgi:hypothetical protein
MIMNLDDQTFAAEAQPNHRLQDIAETCQPHGALTARNEQAAFPIFMTLNPLYGNRYKTGSKIRKCKSAQLGMISAVYRRAS